jgi:hypothetical protein
VDVGGCQIKIKFYPSAGWLAEGVFELRTLAYVMFLFVDYLF